LGRGCRAFFGNRAAPRGIFQPAGDFPVPYIIYLSSINLKKPYIPYPTPVKYFENQALKVGRGGIFCDFLPYPFSVGG
jgi:hypothetical protein